MVQCTAPGSVCFASDERWADGGLRGGEHCKVVGWMVKSGARAAWLEVIRVVEDWMIKSRGRAAGVPARSASALSVGKCECLYPSTAPEPCLPGTFNCEHTVVRGYLWNSYISAEYGEAGTGSTPEGRVLRSSYQVRALCRCEPRSSLVMHAGGHCQEHCRVSADAAYLIGRYSYLPTYILYTT